MEGAGEDPRRLLAVVHGRDDGAVGRAVVGGEVDRF